MSSQELRKIVAKVNDLPSLPLVVNKMLKVAGDSRAAAKDLADIISKDQPLTAKVLKLVNSAFYGFSQKVSTISHAVVILGFYTIKNLALGLSVFSTLKQSKNPSLFDQHEFWKHSLACGICSKVIAVKMKHSVPEEALIAGLLHDIGMLILDRYVNEDFNKILTAVKTEGRSLIEAEIEIIGVNHFIIGGWLAKEWKLPPVLVNAVKYSNNPVLASRVINEESLQMTSIVHIAHKISPVKFIYCDDDTSVSSDILKIVHLSEADILDIKSKVDEELEKSIASFELE